MTKSIAWLSLVAASLALSGCGGGGDQPKDGKPAAAPEKKGEKQEPNPWASDPAAGSAPAEPAKMTKTGKQQEAAENPWAKDPAPGSQPAEPARKAAPTKKGEEYVSPWSKETPNPAAS